MPGQRVLGGENTVPALEEGSVDILLLSRSFVSALSGPSRPVRRTRPFGMELTFEFFRVALGAGWMKRAGESGRG